jgi:RNA 2',3'-cyclic 3'-phosphodiesterase
MRLFVGFAIPDPGIPDSAGANLRVLLNRLRPLADFRWTPVKNLHVTTKFIGEFPEARLDELKRALGAIAVPEPFDISVRGLGWFPNPHHPRVFWAGVDGGEPLRALAAATEQATAQLGVASEDREFRPHLTLARLKAPTPLESIRRGVASLDSQDFGSFRPRGFVLYISSQGQYTSLAEFPLLTRP